MFSLARAVLLGTVLGAAIPAAGEVPPAAVRSVDPRLGVPFRLTVAAAAGRLEAPPCVAVLGRFTDPATGQPLTAGLAASGLGGAEFVLGLTYFSAVGLAPCEDRGTIAFTRPGSRVVFVCPAAFARAAGRDPGFAANTLIHEALHCLGLADDLPSSVEVTRIVERHCGR